MRNRIMKRSRANKKRLLMRRITLLAAVAALTAAVMIAIKLNVLRQGEKLRVLSEEEIAAAVSMGKEAEAGINDASMEKRLALLDAACSIVGEVNYFWGGKSGATGPDPEWGEIREVTSEGSGSTGTMRPYGLDCSGYITWIFVQLGYSFGEAEKVVGNGTYKQWHLSKQIAWEDMRIGDIVFKDSYPTKGVNHVGICVGFLESGEPVYAHCSSTYDNVIVSTGGAIFKHPRRTLLLCEEPDAILN